MKTNTSRFVFPLLAALLNLQALPASAATIHVPADQPTIQQAINAAISGDLVLVSPGTYFEQINYNGKAISVQSTDGPARTIIDGSNTGPTVKIEEISVGQPALTGFTIQHGSASFGAGVTLRLASPIISQNTFRNNAQASGGFGAAIGGNNSSPVIERNVFVGNTCDPSQFISGVVSFINTSSPRIVDNVFWKNPCRAITMTADQPVVANNTIIQNSVGVLVNGGPNSQRYANNILIGNTVGLQLSSTGLTWTNNLVFGNTTNYSGIANQTGLNGNISSDPMFLPTNSRGTFQLQVGSPAIDAGTVSVPNLPPVDFLGNPRFVDGDGNGSVLPDIGAYEFITPAFGVANSLD